MICIFILPLTTGPVITVKNMFKISTVAGKNNKSNLFICDVQSWWFVGLKRSSIHRQKAEIKFKFNFAITNAND